jgi:hypothetical protein
VSAAHQSLHHFVAKADWSDEGLLAAVRARVVPRIETRGPIDACWGGRPPTASLCQNEVVEDLKRGGRP